MAADFTPPPAQPKLTEKEYLIFLDESDRRGKYYSNFYGGVMVSASQYQRVTDLLNARKAGLNFMGEVKWQKVSSSYLGKYTDLIRLFLQEVALGHVRVRIMFSQNANVPQGLTRKQVENEYFNLYYQFVKHAFGLACMPAHESKVNLRLYFDDLPDTEEKRQQFKGFILGLGSYSHIANRGIRLLPENVTEVRSHDHVLLQCMDIVLGSMSFRLNHKHLVKIPGSRFRGKKTVAKEALYKTIIGEIRKIRPNFNIGISTGLKDVECGTWSEPYRHWLFVPKGAVFDAKLAKPAKKGSPARPT